MATRIPLSMAVIVALGGKLNDLQVQAMCRQRNSVSPILTQIPCNRNQGEVPACLLETIKEFQGHKEPDRIVSSIIMVFLLTPSLALMSTNDSQNQLLVGSIGTQIIRVNAFQGMVSIRDNNVLSEWDGVMDYKNALLAIKLFGKMACVIAKIDQAAFPTLDEIMRAMDQQDLEQYPSNHGLIYTVLPIRIKNLVQYGALIKDMCRAVPTYFAKQQKEGMEIATDPNSCFGIQLSSFMGFAICGKIPGL
ncbi:PREDICTED: gastrokine-3-like [Elephantulus edwardii]|uniref:gastrokine-3-like n=1 Tax=Elephantulus edwardii TaxID=28737 RepID=UPI0003F0E031|nr:PREDICTED: gastrokine-3-like [Elephantulus edwardii]